MGFLLLSRDLLNKTMKFGSGVLRSFRLTQLGSDQAKLFHHGVPYLGIFKNTGCFRGQIPGRELILNELRNDGFSGQDVDDAVAVNADEGFSQPVGERREPVEGDNGRFQKSRFQVGRAAGRKPAPSEERDCLQSGSSKSGRSQHKPSDSPCSARRRVRRASVVRCDRASRVLLGRCFCTW